MSTQTILIAVLIGVVVGGGLAAARIWFDKKFLEADKPEKEEKSEEKNNKK